MHEHLIAPRPVRIASNPNLPYRRPTPSSIRSPPSVASMKLISSLSPADPLAKPPADAVDLIQEEYVHRSPPATPRSPAPLPPETLEEFLSILRPSVMPFHSLRVYTTSPIRPSMRSHTPISSLTSVGSDNNSRVSSPEASATQEPRNSAYGRSDRHHSEFEMFMPTWRSGGLLSSPVSRTHTRNPFARRPSHENLAMAMSHHASLQQNPAGYQSDHSPLSPTLIPLPPSTSPPPLSTVQE